jgi:hypothetical protein
MATVATYVRVQATVAGLVNAGLNPLFEWLLNRDKGYQPLWGSAGAVVNLVVTSIILSLLVALFAARGARHELSAGRMRADGGSVRMRRPLSRLPRHGWLLGLLLGAAAAVVVVVACWLLDLLGVSGLTLSQMLVLKAAYCGLLGFGVARWTIFRQLAGRQDRVPG